MTKFLAFTLLHQSVRSIQVVTLFSLYGILMMMFNFYYIPVKVIQKQAAIKVSLSHLLQVTPKQRAF